MRTLSRNFILHVAAASLVATVASAQDSGCSVDLLRPPALTQADFLIRGATNDPQAEASLKALRDAGRVLSEANRFSANPLGYAKVRAELFIVWLHRENQPRVATTESLNMARSGLQTIDLVAAADSLFKMVEAAHPDCAAEVTIWRQSAPWNKRISGAYAQLQAGNVDSAETLGREAGLLDRTSPFLYNLFAQIALRRENRVEALTYFEQAIQAGGSDTANIELVRQLRTEYAQTMQDHAQTLTDPAERTAGLNRARDIFLEIGRENLSAPDSPAYFSTALDVVMTNSDTAALLEIVRPMIADPTKYPDMTLLLGGESSRLMGKTAEAIELYRGVIGKNPYSRDANYFLAYLLIDAKRAVEAQPVLDSLLAIDPGNPDNYLMKSLALRQEAEAERAAPRRAALNREAEAFGRRERELGHRLGVSRFERRADGAVLRGTIENTATAAKAYAITFQFLSVTGEVLDTKEVTTESVAAGDTASFDLRSTVAGIAGWRTGPIR